MFKTTRLKQRYSTPTPENSGTDFSRPKYTQVAVTAQYYLAGTEEAQPYIGAGVAYNRFTSSLTAASKTNLNIASTKMKGRVSPVVEAGVNYDLGDNWMAGTAISYTYFKAKRTITPTSENGDAYTEKFTFAPLIATVTVGYHF